MKLATVIRNLQSDSLLRLERDKELKQEICNNSNNNNKAKNRTIAPRSVGADGLIHSGGECSTSYYLIRRRLNAVHKCNK